MIFFKKNVLDLNSNCLIYQSIPLLHTGCFLSGPTHKVLYVWGCLNPYQKKWNWSIQQQVLTLTFTFLAGILPSSNTFLGGTSQKNTLYKLSNPFLLGIFALMYSPCKFSWMTWLTGVTWVTGVTTYSLSWLEKMIAHLKTAST